MLRVSKVLLLSLVSLHPPLSRAVTPGHAVLRHGVVSLDPDRVNDRDNAPDCGPGCEGTAAVRAQVLLARAHFSPGEIGISIGKVTAKAVKAFQAHHALPETGIVDAATWRVLNADEAPAIVPHEITERDVGGPFVAVPHDMMAKARLKRLGYGSPLEELAERFHASPVLLERLNPGKSLRAGARILVPDVGTPPPGVAARVVVNGKVKSVAAYDAAGNLLAWYPATTGSRHDPLPIGRWTITGKIFDPEFHYDSDLFWDAAGAHAKATIAPGPNNPVGLVWMNLSKEHYGIHGTPDPSDIGKTFSHGCIRLTNWDALELARMVKPGTPAIFTNGRERGPGAHSEP